MNFITKKAKSMAMLSRIEPGGGISLTNHEKCEIMRQDIDISRREFDEIIQFIFEENFINIKCSNGSVFVSLTAKGRELAGSETMLRSAK